jgi:hypothetical protein
MLKPPLAAGALPSLAYRIFAEVRAESSVKLVKSVEVRKCWSVEVGVPFHFRKSNEAEKNIVLDRNLLFNLQPTSLPATKNI